MDQFLVYVQRASMTHIFYRNDGYCVEKQLDGA